MSIIDKIYNHTHTIHVCYALYDAGGAYSKFLGASICSLLENTKAKVTIHILHDDTLTEENRKKLTEQVETYNQKIEFYPVKLDDKTFKRFEHIKVSPGSLYRLSICRTLPETIEKVVYFDVDTIIHTDISELWNEDLKGNAIGAIVDACLINIPGRMLTTPVFSLEGFDQKRYFNSGVLLMDLKKIREDFANFFEDMLNLIEQHQDWYYTDQDALNYLFNKKYYELPYKYNKLVYWEMLNKAAISEGVYHYAGNVYGVENNPYNKLFWHYFAKCRWFNGEFLADSLALIPSTAAYYLKTCLNIMLPLANAKRKQFIVANDDVKNQMTKLFPENERNVYQVMQKDNPKLQINKEDMFVFLVDGYPNIKNALEQQGYKERVNFMDGFLLYNWSEGRLMLNEYNLIKGL